MNMKGENFLLAVAQISLALGGFTGLINAFRHMGQDWLPQEIAGMKLIFQHCFAGVFFALLPFPLFYMWDLEPMAWQYSSLALAVFLAFQLCINAFTIGKLLGAGTPPRRLKMLLFHFFPFTLGLLTIQVIKLFRWQGPSAYAWGLIWLLNPPAIQFYHFLLSAKISTGLEEPSSGKK